MAPMTDSADTDPNVAGTDPSDAGTGLSDLSYEQARDELVDIVRRLESGGGTLEESLQLWERGERLAAHCEQWLAGARKRMDALVEARSGDGRPDDGDDAPE
jgi:exodeoxyribonuclease VII small subunit